MYRPGGTETPVERALSETELKAFLLKKRLPYSTKPAHSDDTAFDDAAASGAGTRDENGIRSRERTWSIPDEHAKKGRGQVLPLSGWAVEEIRSLMGIARACS
jgi:hypothetical protein